MEQTKDKGGPPENKIHCEIFGFSVPMDECAELKKNKYHECSDCDGKPKKTIKKEVEMSKESEAKVESGKRKYTMSDAVLRARKEVGKKRKAKNLSIEKPIETPRGIIAEPEHPIKRGRKAKVVGVETPQPGPIGLSQGVAAAAAEPKGPLQIVIDFSEHPDLHKTLTTLAENEMRTPAVQALFLLKHGDFKNLRSSISAT